MSIADKITQLTNIRANIRTALVNKGVAASTHNYADFAADIASIVLGDIINGSLILATCSTDIDEVKAVANDITYTGYLDTNTNTAYITIPYTFTSGIVTVTGYTNGVAVATDSVTMTGINKYCCGLYSSTALYNDGTWNTRFQNWFVRNTSDANSSSPRVTNSTSGYLIITVPSQASATIGYTVTSYPIVLPKDCTAVKATMTKLNTPYISFGIFPGNTISADYTSFITCSVGENTFTVPSSLRRKEIYLWFGAIADTSSLTQNRVTKIELVMS